MRVARWPSLALAVIVSAVLVAPAHAQGGVDIKPAAKIKRDKYFILPDEIAEKPDLTNGYDIIKVLRNQWLRVTRGNGGSVAGTGGPTRPGDLSKGCPQRNPDPNCSPAGSSSGGGGPVPSEHGSPYAETGTSVETAGAAGPVLYIDEVKQENLEQLRNIRSDEIAEIHYLTGNIAVGRYGAGHENGAIMLKTAKFNKP